MHLAIDVREACAPERTGKGQWTYGFVSALLLRDVSLTLFTDRALPSEWQHVVDAKKNIVVRLLSQSGLRWHFEAAKIYLHDASLDVYVSPVSYIVPWIIGRRKKVVTIVHDLIAFMNEPHDRKATIIERLTLPRAARSTATICTVSETTKHDLCERFPALSASRVHAIFAGPASATSAQNHSDHKTILCVGTLCPRKNQLRLIHAYQLLPSSLRERVRLVLVGKRGWHDEEIIRLAHTTHGVEWKQYLPNHEVDALMHTAAVLALPSLYEGFGMPVLDAMRIGLPVVTSNKGSLKEVAGDAALLVDPENVDSIARGLQRILEDDALHADYAAKGKKQAERFDWARTADLFLKALNN